MTEKISVLVSARKNSKYLAKFIFGYLEKTSDLNNCELLVMTNDDDTWNEDLIAYFLNTKENIRFFTENLGLGRGGLHQYFNSLVMRSNGHWIIYFCDDHYIAMDGWDSYTRNFISDKNLNSNDVWCIVPKFENVGAMNHIVSRGYIRAMGGILGRHGNIDSYINDVCSEAFGLDKERPENRSKNRLVRMDDEMFYDFTHDVPNQLDDFWTKTEPSDAGLSLPQYDSARIRQWIKEDALKLRRAM